MVFPSNKSVILRKKINAYPAHAAFLCLTRLSDICLHFCMSRNAQKFELSSLAGQAGSAAISMASTTTIIMR